MAWLRGVLPAMCNKEIPQRPPTTVEACQQYLDHAISGTRIQARLRIFAQGSALDSFLHDHLKPMLRRSILAV